jgi:hypothetical protein
LDLSLLLAVLLFLFLAVLDLMPNAKLDVPPLAAHAPSAFLGR